MWVWLSVSEYGRMEQHPPPRHLIFRGLEARSGFAESLACGVNRSRQKQDDKHGCHFPGGPDAGFYKPPVVNHRSEGG